MKTKLLCFVSFTLFFIFTAKAQVGIGTTTPDSSTVLDITSTDKGVLIPRVSLVDVSNITAPVNNPTTGLLVYNTNASVTGGSGEGFYYFNGTIWVKFVVTDGSVSTNLTDIGVISAFAGVTYPNDMYLPLDGGTFNDVDYPEFAAFIPSLDADVVTDNGNGTFTLADWNNQGIFLRGQGGNAAALGALQNDATAQANNNFILPSTTVTTSTDGEHTHDYSNTTTWELQYESVFDDDVDLHRFTSTASTSPSGDHNHQVTIPLTNITGGDIETRPINRSITWVIKVKPSASSVNSLTINNITDIGTDDQNLTAASLTGTTLNLGIESGTGTSVNLAALQDGTGTDDQTISLSGTTLSIEDGNNVNLSGIDTDDQTLSFTGTTLSIQDGNSVNLSALQDGTGTDDQNLTAASLTGTTLNLNIENGTGTSVNLAALQDGTGTDDQNIQNLAFNTGTNVLTVGIENGTSQTVNLSALDSGGDINQVTAGTGLTGGGTSGSVTINAVGVNGLTTNADDIRLGGTLIQDTNINYGAFDTRFNLNSTGDFIVQDNGTAVFFVEDSGDVGFGTNNPAYQVHVLENTATEARAVYVDKDDNTTASTEGVYVAKTSNGTGRNHGYFANVNGTGNGNRYGIYTDVNGTGTGQKYGIFNELDSNTAGSQYAVRNWVRGESGNNQFGVFNNMDNANTADIFGVYNGMRVTNASNMYGVYNEFLTANSSTTLSAGVRNRFTNGTPGTEGFAGMYTDFDLGANGTYYGVRNEYGTGSTGTGEKYGTYNLISSSAGGTHYGTYNSVNVNDGWAGYFLGKNYISTRLSIGELDNPTSRLNILINSGSTSHIELKEGQANDGARLRFTNAAETTNRWTLYGRADNTNSDSQFNIHYSPTNTNLMRLEGDGDLEFLGDLGINFNNPVFDLQLGFNSAAKPGSNTWFVVSDRRLKQNIKPYNKGMDLIEQLNPVSFQYNGKAQITDKGTYIGFIAQDIRKVAPQMVNEWTTEQGESFLALDTNEVQYAVINALKEQQKQIQNLEAENKTLKQQLNKLQQLEARLLALENNTNKKASTNAIIVTED